MADRTRVEGAVLELVQGDITKEAVDAIVNAANSSLMGGGGVDGAIHRAGGAAILEECKQIRDRQGRLPTGEAVRTTAGTLPARWVIHSVGPRWAGGDSNEPALLASCYRRSLAVAREAGARTVAFPSISTGIYGYPVEQAAAIAVRAVLDELQAHPGAVELVRFVLFDGSTLAAYQRALSAAVQAAD